MSLSDLSFKTTLTVAVLAATLLLVALPVARLQAADAIFAPGDPIVTGFSGVVPPSAPPAGSDPLDYTFINLDGQSMVIQQLQPSGAAAGQLIPSPAKFSATAKDVGQVFGVTVDDAPEATGLAAPDIYLAATSAFGLNIVVPDADGNPTRSKVGAPNATFMPGQWGNAGGEQGYPGSIWKVDGVTGKISLFSTIAADSGAGLGNIVYDPASSQLFVSDLDSGLIYRLALDGTITDSFDHGVTGRPTHGLAAVADDGSEMDVTNPAFKSDDPTTWGFTQPERRVNGLAMHGGRLYYAVADGPQIWSVGINADGSFGTPRWELDVTGLPSTNEITSIAFDPQGRMILAQRGAVAGSYDFGVLAQPNTSSVVRYTREYPDDPATPSQWVETPDSYAIGFASGGTNASGGIALGYAYDETNNTFGGACSAYLWSTGDALRDDPSASPPLDPPAQIAGLQGNARNLVRPDNDPPQSSFFADYDGNTADSEAANLGHVGAVTIWQNCEGPDVEPPPDLLPPPNYVAPTDVNLTLDKWAKPFCFDGGADWWCKYTIRVENTGTVPYWGPIVVDDYLPAANPGASMHFSPQPPWTCSPTGPDAYKCATGPDFLFPGDSVDLHEIVKLPKAMVTYCQIANAAGLQWPFWGGDSDPSDDFGLGVALIAAPGCVAPGGGTDLLLKKIAVPATCSDGGLAWICSYLVTVQNVGPGPYSGPITVKDTLGVNAPVTTFGPWACGPIGPVVTCHILAPPVNVLPGWTSGFVLQAHVKKNIGPPLCTLDNKANINVPVGGSPNNLLPGDDFDHATSHIPDPACFGPHPHTDLEIQKSGLGCFATVHLGVNGYACDWQLTLTNLGPSVYTGPLSFRDTSADATLDTLKTIAPAVCTGPNPVVTCTLPGSVTLNPGVPSSLPFATFYPGGPTVCTATNNVSILAPTPGSPLNPAGNDSASASQVLPNPACAPPTSPKLNIQKTAEGCASDPSSPDWLCDFKIKVSNLGGSAQPAPIKVTDTSARPTTFSGAACVPAGVGHWVCTRPTPLNGGANWTFTATSHVDPNGVSLADCTVVNTVKITTPSSADPGYAAQSTQKVPQLFINLGPGPVAVYCDPPSLKLAKTAGASVKSGNGYNTSFTVDATSTGPDPYHGTVELDELLPAGTSYVSSSWACAPTTGNDVHCSSPNVNLAVGQSVSMTIVVHTPNDVAIRDKCAITNTVNASISAAVLHSSKGAQYTASATAKLPATACAKPPACPTNQIKPGGGCCDTDLVWDGRQCAPPKPVVPTCPDDSHFDKRAQDCVCNAPLAGTPGQCKANIVPLPTCPDDSHIDRRTKDCVCNAPLTGTPGQCKSDIVPLPTCPDDSHIDRRSKDCVCNSPLTGTPGQCKTDIVPLANCPLDSHFDKQTNACMCNAPLTGVPGQCQPEIRLLSVCPKDSHFDKRSNACICNPPLKGKPGQCVAELALPLNGLRITN